MRAANIFAVLGLAMVLPSLQALDWASWRGPFKNGITSEKIALESLPKDGPVQLWKAKVGVGFASTAVANDRAYTVGNLEKSDTATLWCLDAGTGKVNWKREWPSKLTPMMYEGGPNSTPVVDGQWLYVVIKPTLLLCLDAATGESRWEKDLKAELDAETSPWGITSSPLVEGNSLVINYGSNGTSLDKNTGKVLWTTGKKGHSYCVPALARQQGEPTLMVFATNALVAVNLKNGSEKWRQPFGEGYFCHSADPLVNGDEVYMGSADHGGEVIRFADGKPVSLWKNRTMGNFTASSVVLKGCLYGINHCDSKDKATELKCVDWKTGQVRWAKSDGFGSGSFIVADDKLVVLSDKGELSVVQVSPDRYELLYRAQVLGGKCWTTPSLANGRLFLRNAAGDLVCLQVGELLPRS